MADFTTSTHRKRWILNPNDLTRRYQTANQRAVDALQKYGATRVEVQSDGSLTYPGAGGDGENGWKGSLPEHLSIEEELLVRRFYENKIQQVCAAFRLPNKIQATAIMYFKRFYQQWSVMEHDPKNIMLTCIYLACKVEESHVSAEELGKGIQQDPQVVLKNEMIVLQGLEFELIVYTPYRSMEGFIYDLEPFVQRMGTAGLQALQGLRTAAGFIVDKMMLTDAPLLYPPGQLALAALRIANQEEPKVDLDGYLQDLPEHKRLQHSCVELMAKLDAIQLLVKESKQPLEAEVRHIDRKLKYCRNPSLQDEAKGKRERKTKKGDRKRPPSDVAMANGVHEPLDLNVAHSAKRRQSEGDVMI
ncbi:hypothetical protein KC19_VG306500 [Ceratodon purpureus]|uniref:Cyclin-H1-1 n=1 Tax=Ceratodon purpureus TaxID=3225 RepID=A0A8T0HVU8_CERPU|nr:hypothetical protein KC19_VG306500 [Ceratodon purpureus]